jgi:predicted transcriptional regulator
VVYKDGEAFEVEFMTLDGDTFALATLMAAKETDPPSPFQGRQGLRAPSRIWRIEASPPSTRAMANKNPANEIEILSETGSAEEGLTSSPASLHCKRAREISNRTISNMASVPFSLRLDPAVKRRLDREARKADRSASYLATKAIEAFLDAREAKRQAIQAALKEAGEGVFVSSEAVASWMDSWGGESELAPPEPDVFPKGE